MGHRPRRGLSRYLCDRHRMVANQSKLAVGGLHRPPMALFAAPAAAFARVTLAADRDPAARDPGAANVVVWLRYFPVDVFSGGDRCRRHAPRLVQCRCRGNFRHRVLRELVSVQSRVDALGRGRLVGRRAFALRAPSPPRGAAAVGRSHTGVAGAARPLAVARPARGRMTDFDHNAIDEVMQSRVRIAIVAFLASAGNVDFAGIRDAIKTSDGNTSVHLRKLEEAGYVSVDKRFVQRKPQTRYALTDRGRTALLDHVAHLEMLLRSKKSGRENDK